MTALLIIAGLALLCLGAEWLVRGASSLALRLGIPPLVVGLTVVAFGTSAPELVVSIDAALKSHGDIAVGNVVGSNIFNILAILGLAALVRPLRVKSGLLRFDMPVMIAVSLLLLALLVDSRLTFFEGLLLTSGIVLYTYLNLKGPRDNRGHEDKTGTARGSPLFSVLYIAGGLGVLVAGARFLVTGAVDLARFLNVNEAVIGLTIVAAGTSLPELATSVVAGIKKHDDIAIGNIVGSNVFNILAILGISSMLEPLDSSGILLRDLAVMVAAAVVLLPLMYSRFVLSRVEGAGLLCAYAGYLYVLWPR